MARERLDCLLVERGLADDLDKARAMLMAGQVFSSEKRLDKAGTLVRADIPLEIRGRGEGWVSRGAGKLKAAIEAFHIDPMGLIALDVGASTGGFTHVLLRHGAKRVYAVDVGKGLLDWQLRNDPRVQLREGQNARFLDATIIPEPIDLIVCDASFIRLATVLPAAMALASAEARLVALIKPQFEAAAREVGQGGVVRDATIRTRICDGVRHWLDAQPGWHATGLVESPVRGPAGNIEYLVAASRTGPV
ncbi:TlyA family RNA methyltransferase [Arboricoccus pini]|uniref:TlyA family RNA methyltransferase n=1 Tax=Arboricoccus pini TaxID=1963835 RepID=UPI000B50C414|nr:TlyA family RNA methyltransferase [Arboricoccus pini]